MACFVVALGGTFLLLLHLEARRSSRKDSGCWIRAIKWGSEVILIRKATAVTFCKILHRSRSCQAAECATVRVAFFGFYFFGWGRWVSVALDGFGAAAGGLIRSGDGRRRSWGGAWSWGHGCCNWSRVAGRKRVIPHGVQSSRWCVKSGGVAHHLMTLTTYSANKLNCFIFTL